MDRIALLISKREERNMKTKLTAIAAAICAASFAGAASAANPGFCGTTISTDTEISGVSATLDADCVVTLAPDTELTMRDSHINGDYDYDFRILGGAGSAVEMSNNWFQNVDEFEIDINDTEANPGKVELGSRVAGPPAPGQKGKDKLCGPNEISAEDGIVISTNWGSIEIKCSMQYGPYTDLYTQSSDVDVSSDHGSIEVKDAILQSYLDDVRVRSAGNGKIEVKKSQLDAGDELEISSGGKVEVKDSTLTADNDLTIDGTPCESKDNTITAGGTESICAP